MSEGLNRSIYKLIKTKCGHLMTTDNYKIFELVIDLKSVKIFVLNIETISLGHI